MGRQWHKKVCNVVLTFHLPLVVDYDACIVLKDYKRPVLSPNGFSLTDDHSRHNLFPELWLSLLDGGDEHVPGAGGGHPVEATLDAVHSDHKQVLGTCVVCTI